MAFAPAAVQVLVASVQARVDPVRRRAGGFVQASVRAAQPAQVDHALGHVQRAAGQVHPRARLRHHFLAAQRHRAALRGPLADAVAQVGQVAAHLQQAAGRVPALALVAAHARRHRDQAAPVHPQLAVEQLGRVAVVSASRSSLPCTLILTLLDAIAIRTPTAPATSSSAPRAEAAPRRRGRDLPARGQRQRAALELDVAAADDLDARLVAPVRQARQVVERARRLPVTQQVLLGRLS